MRARALRAAACAIFMMAPACAEMASPKVASPASEAPGFVGGMMEERAATRADADDGRIALNRPAPPAPPGGPAPPPPPPAAPADGGKRDGGGEVAQLRGPMLIYTARITMAVFEVNASLAKVEAIGKEMGGFLAKRDDRSATIRIPAQRFEEAVRRVEEVGDMLHRNVTADDVTEEFRDLEVRLGSARAVQKRLTELLARANKVEESIAIERELDRVTGEIDRIEGRMKFIRDRVSFSTITVTFEPKPKEQVGAGGVRLPVGWLYDLGLRRLLSL